MLALQIADSVLFHLNQYRACSKVKDGAFLHPVQLLLIPDRFSSLYQGIPSGMGPVHPKHLLVQKWQHHYKSSRFVSAALQC